MQPGKEAFDESAALIPSVVAVILGLEYAGEPMRRNEIHAVLFEIVIEAIVVIGSFKLANEVFALHRSVSSASFRTPGISPLGRSRKSSRRFGLEVFQGLSFRPVIGVFL